MKDYLKDYLAGRKQEEFPPHPREDEVPEVPKAISEGRNDTSGTFGTSRRVGYPENLEARSAAYSPNDPEINWRVEAMLLQVPASGAIPFLVAKPDSKTEAGYCLSCGEWLKQGEPNRCTLCNRAANKALDLAMSKI